MRGAMFEALESRPARAAMTTLPQRGRRTGRAGSLQFVHGAEEELAQLRRLLLDVQRDLLVVSAAHRRQHDDTSSDAIASSEVPHDPGRAR